MWDSKFELYLVRYDIETDTFEDLESGPSIDLQTTIYSGRTLDHTIAIIEDFLNKVKIIQNAHPHPERLTLRTHKV